MRESIAVSVTEPSQAGEARRVAIALARRLGFDETQRGKVGIVVTELASNLVQHTQGGMLLLRALEQQNHLGIEVLSLDKGPGMRDVEECFNDGFSTAGTPGNGLGAIQRLSDLCQIYSTPELGTALLVQLWAAPLPPSQEPLILGAVCLPKVGEEVSGDAWATDLNPQRCQLLVSDGLGHGPLAASASLEAIKIFEENAQRSPQIIIEAAHPALRSTRGAALAIAEIDLEQQSVRFAGIGNIAAVIQVPDAYHHLVSHNGTVGHAIRKIQEFTYPWHPYGLLIMHSDGLATQWRLDRYAGLIQKHPSLIAGVLYRDFKRDRDDVTVLVAKGAAR